MSQACNHYHSLASKFETCLVLQETIIHQANFAPSLGITLSDLHTSTVKKYTSVSRCCEKCVPVSKVRVGLEEHATCPNLFCSFLSQSKFLPDPNGGGVGLQNILVVDKRKYRYSYCISYPYLDGSLVC